jgi:hypothetical protein
MVGAGRREPEDRRKRTNEIKTTPSCQVLHYNPQLPPSQEAPVVSRDPFRVAVGEVRDFELNFRDVVVGVFEVDDLDGDGSRGREVNAARVDGAIRGRTRAGDVYGGGRSERKGEKGSRVRKQFAENRNASFSGSKGRETERTPCRRLQSFPLPASPEVDTCSFIKTRLVSSSSSSGELGKGCSTTYSLLGSSSSLPALCPCEIRLLAPPPPAAVG